LAISLLACLAALFFCVSIAQAQVQTATVSGTAKDTSGGVLAGAAVAATNVATNSARSTITDSNGRYTIFELPIGSYDVQATMSGFQTVVHKGITLTVGANLVVDFSLPVGAVAQTVNVEAQVSQVETTTAAVSSLVTSKQVADLPLNGRNYTQLLYLAPGVAVLPSTTTVSVSGGGSGLYGNQTNISVGGSRPEGQAYLIDNEDVRDFFEHGAGMSALATALGVEGIAEFQVLTNSYSSQFAGNGVVMNSATKSGSNTLHGSAYEFFRNSALDGRNFFDFASTGKCTATCGAPGSIPVVTGDPIPPFRQNQFGGSLGGPVIKDKLFFFGNYEGFRSSLGSTFTSLVPMPYVANGYLPTSKVNASLACGTAPVGTPPPPSSGGPYTYVGFGCLDSQPSQAADAAASVRGVLALFNSAAGVRGADEGGYQPLTTVRVNTASDNYYMGRMDYNLSSNDTLFGRYISERATQFLPASGSAVLSDWPETDHNANQFFTLQERHIVSATTVNSLRGIFTRTYAAAVSGSLPNPTGVACSAAACPDPLQFVAKEPYAFNDFIDGRVTAGCPGCTAIGSPGLVPYTLAQEKYGGGDDLAWTHGAHSFKAGIAVTRVLTVAYSTFGFGETFTFLSEQNFLGGAAYGNTGNYPGHGNADRHFRELDFAPYFEDDWKVSNRLTLDLGFRWDFVTDPRGGPFNVVVHPPLPDTTPYYVNVLTGAGPSFATGFTPASHVFQGNPNVLNLEPRIGVVFDPFADHKTAIRAGFGIFHDQVEPREYAGEFYTNWPDAEAQGTGTFPPFPNAFPGITPGGEIKESVETGAESYSTSASPYVMQYSLTIQRQLAAGMVLSVGYIGAEGRHQFSSVDLNAPMCNTPGTAPGSEPTSNPAICGSLTTLPNFWSGVGTVPNPRINTTPNPYTASLPGAPPGGFPFFGQQTWEIPISTSNYNSLQVTLNRQFRGGLQAQAAYTYSRCMTTGSGSNATEQTVAAEDDPYNRLYDYGLCSFDIRHNLVVNGVYALPFKGNRLVGGWELATILRAATGIPLYVSEGGISGTDTALLGGYQFDRMNYSGTCPGGKGQVLGHWYDWFNSTCYSIPPLGSLGDVPDYSLEGPGVLSLDTSIIKDTKIWEKLNTEFRAEFFNVLNHTNLGVPNGSVLSNLTTFAPVGNAGNDGSVRATSTTSRQIQFALKLIF
jgi:hypothetical protein